MDIRQRQWDNQCQSTFLESSCLINNRKMVQKQNMSFFLFYQVCRLLLSSYSAMHFWICHARKDLRYSSRNKEKKRSGEYNCPVIMNTSRFELISYLILPDTPTWNAGMATSRAKVPARLEVSSRDFARARLARLARGARDVCSIQI